MSSAAADGLHTTPIHIPRVLPELGTTVPGFAARAAAAERAALSAGEVNGEATSKNDLDQAFGDTYPRLVTIRDNVAVPRTCVRVAGSLYRQVK